MYLELNNKTRAKKMAKTVRKRKGNDVHIYADYGQGRRQISSAWFVEKFTLKDLKELAEGFGGELDAEECDFLMQAMSVFSESNRSYIWKISPNIDLKSNQEFDGDVFYKTKKDAIDELMSVLC